ncbi:hypothetical protein AB0N89_06670 [Amycolatopsis sp. NPDC089917]|uniref:hypothetical protein n=1 Tax=Amycolatopsis sp. NPDC089917 TaxID=3155187 RepID=UPI0034158CBA
MQEFRELLRSVRQRPGLYLLDGSDLDYRQAVTFVTGLDLGTNGRLLDGFREFLVLKADVGANLVWSSLVRIVVHGRDHRSMADKDDQVLVDGLWDLLDEFLAETAAAGSRRIHHEYFLWCQSSRRSTWTLSGFPRRRLVRCSNSPRRRIRSTRLLRSSWTSSRKESFGPCGPGPRSCSSAPRLSDWRPSAIT